jgi:hypothetical protein
VGYALVICAHFGCVRSVTRWRPLQLGVPWLQKSFLFLTIILIQLGGDALTGLR